MSQLPLLYPSHLHLACAEGRCWDPPLSAQAGLPTRGCPGAAATRRPWPRSPAHRRPAPHLNSVPRACESHEQNRSKTRPRHVLLRPRAAVALPCHELPNYSVPAPAVLGAGNRAASSSTLGRGRAGTTLPRPCGEPKLKRSRSLPARPSKSQGTVAPWPGGHSDLEPVPLCPSRPRGLGASPPCGRRAGDFGRRQRQHPRPAGQVLESDSGYARLKIRGGGRVCDGRTGPLCHQHWAWPRPDTPALCPQNPGRPHATAWEGAPRAAPRLKGGGGGGRGARDRWVPVPRDGQDSGGGGRGKEPRAGLGAHPRG